MIIDVPFVRQQCLYDCLPACLKMLLAHKGIEMSLAEIKRKIDCNYSGTLFESAPLFLASLNLRVNCAYFDPSLLFSLHKKLPVSKIIQTLNRCAEFSVDEKLRRKALMLIAFLQKGGRLNPDLLSLSELKLIIDKGYPVITVVEGGYLYQADAVFPQRRPHSMLVVGYENEEIICHDPAWRDGYNQRIMQGEFLKAWYLTEGKSIYVQ